MYATPEELKVMFSDDTTEELEAQLASCEATIKELYSYGRAWALDCRQMRVAEHNSSHVRAELRRRKTGDSQVQSSQVGPAVYREIK